ncbi:MAG: hypothetical protein ABSA92_06490 [Candidatus Bathyarchaeia archaeon]
MECAACGSTVNPSQMKCYTIRKGNERHVVCFCKACHSAFQREMKGAKNPKVGRSVKKVVSALGTVGFMVMLAVFSLAMFAFKQIMKTKFGKEESDGAGEPNFAEAGAEKEPMLDDYSQDELAGFEVSDESGTFPADELVHELWETDGTFSSDEVDFTDSNQTFSSDDFDLD